MPEKQPPRSLGTLSLVWFRAGDDEVHLFEEESMGGASTNQHLALQVDSLDEYRARFAEHGVSVREDMPIVNRPRCFVRDPFGNLIEILEVSGPYDGEV